MLTLEDTKYISFTVINNIELSKKKCQTVEHLLLQQIQQQFKGKRGSQLIQMNPVAIFYTYISGGTDALLQKAEVVFFSSKTHTVDHGHK